MSAVPPWAFGNTDRVFRELGRGTEADLVALRATVIKSAPENPRALRRVLARAFRDGVTPNAVLTGKDGFAGWQVTEASVPGIDHSLTRGVSLFVFRPHLTSPTSVGLDIHGPVLTIAAHAIARLFERDIQPVGDVVAQLRDPALYRTLLDMIRKESPDRYRGLTFRFGKGQLVGSVMTTDDSSRPDDEIYCPTLRTYIHKPMTEPYELTAVLKDRIAVGARDASALLQLGHNPIKLLPMGRVVLPGTEPCG